MARFTLQFLTVLLISIASVSVSAAERAGTVLITGANRGIGLAMAESFSKAGYSVIGTARNPDRAIDLKKLSATVVQLDVSKPESVAAFAKQIGNQPIDILINNAGMLSKEASDFEKVDIEALVTEFQVNALGPLRVTQALLPNILAGERKIVANISSLLASMELNNFGCCLGYGGSKAALNSFTNSLADKMADSGIAFVMLHPGYVKTDLNGGAGSITTAQSASALYTVISGLSAADNGKFLKFDGETMPW